MDDRNIARSFSGLKDEEWSLFTASVTEDLGSGKRSFMIATMIRRYNENRRWAFERQATTEQRANHAVNDTLGFLGIKWPFSKNVSRNLDN